MSDYTAAKTGSLDATGMRYHEVALQRWLNQVFLLRWGPPIPVVISSPMDAFAEFTRLWANADNAYGYLLQIRDAKGAQVYQPYPSPVRYPIISVYRRNYKLRPSHNFSTHRIRPVSWPTVSDSVGVVPGKPDQQGVNLHLGDLGNALTVRYPMAIDYRFQIDFFANRPDTQAYFLTQLWRQFWRTGGDQLQTWIYVDLPVLGRKQVRLYLDGEVENMTPEAPEDGKNVEFRVSFTVVIEGYEADLQYKIEPTLWKVVNTTGAVPPESLGVNFTSSGTLAGVDDLRGYGDDNPVVRYRSEIADMPSNGTYTPDTNNPP